MSERVENEKVDNFGIYHQSWKVPGRDIYCLSRTMWLYETIRCLLVLNAIHSTATGRRWLLHRA